MAEKKSPKTEKTKSTRRLKLRRAGKETQPTGKKRRFHILPKPLRNAWAEVRQVTWPGRKETVRLTIAVLIFSIIFGAFIAVLDLALDKLFKEVILR
jgi:preprotein translocase subunit SecE